MVAKSDFFGYEQYTIQTEALSVSVITLGATVTSLRFAGRELALRYSNAQGYLEGNSYIGAIVGRYANRIRDGKVTIGGKPIQLAVNEGKNQLHGGPNAFDRRRWTAEILGENAVRFSLFSPDGDNGYPGNLTAAVTYTVAGASLRLDFTGECDAETIFAPTTHQYFNLSGTETILNTTLQIFADGVVETDAALIPTGKVLPCDGLLDFRTPRPIGKAYDHCFILNGRRACIASDGGITMELETDFPGLQLYTGEHLCGEIRQFGGFAIEPAYCPDSPNLPQFDSPALHAGERFQKYALYRFFTEKNKE